MMQPKLPRDLLKVPANNRIAKYAEIEAACREALAQRIDLSYQFYLDEAGERGWVEDIQAKFQAKGQSVSGRSLRDDVKIFETLRMPAPHGLGLTRAQISRYSYGRMRVLAQNREWTMSNTERACELLEDPNASEPKMRELIQLDAGKTVASVPVVKFAIPEKKAKAVEQALDDVAKELEKSGKKIPENRGELLLNIIAEWRRLKKSAR